MEKLRVFEAFAGYGSQSMALERLGIAFEVVGISEIDKYAIQAYMAVHGETKNYGDISKINWKEVPDFDFFTYSFPCQDISNAGTQKGLEEGSGTRSSLLWECKKAIEAKKPKYLLMENVKALTSQKFKPYLNKWTNYLESLGYTCYTRVLNSKDYGVPQNRDRCFMVSIQGNQSFFFPKEFPLEKRLKDVLENNVDEKYYLNKKQVQSITDHCERKVSEGCGFKPAFKTEEEIATCISTRYGGRQTDTFLKVPQYYKNGMANLRRQDVHGTTGVIEILEPVAIGYTRDKKSKVVDRHLMDVTNTIHTSTGQGGNTDCLIAEPNVLTPKRTEYGKAIRKEYESGKLEESRHNMTEMQPRTDGVSNTITTVQKDNLLVEPQYNGQSLRIPQATAKGYIEVEPGGVFDGSYPESKTRRGRVQGGGKICPTITSQGEPLNVYEGVEYKGIVYHEGDGLYTGTSENFIRKGLPGVSRTIKAGLSDAGVVQNYRIRKLTPRECFRLMGVSDSDIDKIEAAGISRTQQYRMAGNSIVVDVLCHIFRKMFIEKECESVQLSLF